MIGKVITGKSFGGCVRYVVEKQDAVLLDAAGVRMGKVSQIVNDFNLQRKYNPDLGKAVGHIALSWSVNDKAKLSDEVMVSIAKQYLQKMKIQDTQYLIVKHQDKDHPHIHIVYNRVNNYGKTITDNFQKQRNIKVTQELTLKHGFYFSPGKDHVNRQHLKGKDKIKYELFDAISSTASKVRTFAELEQVLAQLGVGIQFKYTSGSNEIQGISFSKGEFKFKGSEIDRSLSFGRLSQQLAQQTEAENDIIYPLRETLLNAELNDDGYHASAGLIDIRPDPQTRILENVISTGLDFVAGALAQTPTGGNGSGRKKRNRDFEEDEEEQYQKKRSRSR